MIMENNIKGLKVTYLPMTEEEKEQTKKDFEAVLSKIASRIVGKNVKVTVHKKEELNNENIRNSEKPEKEQNSNNV